MMVSSERKEYERIDIVCGVNKYDDKSSLEHWYTVFLQIFWSQVLWD